jgi:D-glycero-D-manno-heptose 1,7-bisphosphate phosphatase
MVANPRAFAIFASAIGVAPFFRHFQYMPTNRRILCLRFFLFAQSPLHSILAPYFICPAVHKNGNRYKMTAMSKPNKRRPVVFLDRDGTLNVEAGYIHELERLVLIEGAAEAVKRLNDAGVAAVLVTNQTGAARGYYSEQHILDLNARLVQLLSSEGAHLDAIYYCPHLKDGSVGDYSYECNCRKPEIGMVEQAYKEHVDLDRSRSFVIGDKSTDVELAKNCGAKGILVTTGYGEAVLKGEYQWPVEPDFQASSIVQAVDWILAQLEGESAYQG